MSAAGARQERRRRGTWICRSVNHSKERSMSRSRSILITLAALPIAALVVAGCGGSKSSAPADHPERQAGPTVGVASTGSATRPRRRAGPHALPVPAGHGRDEHVHRSVRRPTGRRCRRTASPAQEAAVQASLLGTSRRSDGKLQVTYDGHSALPVRQRQRCRNRPTARAVSAFGALWHALARGQRNHRGSAELRRGGYGY